jgi:undecaprenyl-diphosphatase
VPKPELPPPAETRFFADPVVDGAAVSLAFGFAGLSEALINTGEIKPQQPNSESKPLAIDRGTIDAEPVPAWGTISNVALGSAVVYAVIDPVHTAFRQNTEAGIVDAVIYAEAIGTTWALTNLAKMAVRRPRPLAYQEQRRLEQVYGKTNAPDITETDYSLSFFSGHAAITATISATASYLAFARSPDSPRPWLTLAGGVIVTTVASVGRVKSGKHFPTDVIAGAMVGAGVGVLVPHLHRQEAKERRPVWIGIAPLPDGAAVTAAFAL